MKLLLDIGNQSLKWALSEDGRFTRAGRIDHGAGSLLPHLEQAWGGFARPDRVVVSNVAGAALATALSAWCRQRWQLEPHQMQATATAAGVHNAYSVPGTLGIDRWAAIVAAYARFRSTVCVADCGTAITLDLVDADGRHQGGLILPGIGLMQTALRTNTANLQEAGGSGALPLLSTNTGDAIVAGSVYAAAAAIEQITRQMTTRCPGPVHRILTGGDAERLVSLLDPDWVVLPDLVLQGLELLSGEE